jgi:diguanylate cyclase (GGDEF)-like protein
VLTGLPNRRGMQLRLEGLVAHARRMDAPLAMLLCDIDHFKSVNDEHGHHRGDAVLVEAGEAIRRSLRASEQVYRVGGEEFLILLPGCDADLAAPVAQRVRRAIEAAEPGGLPVTASLGMSAATGLDVDFDELFKRADSALYAAKGAGRNRVAQAPVAGLA